MTEQTKKKTRACRDTDYLFVSAYLRAKEPGVREKAYAWKTAIGLQKVDGLTPTEYLVETARRNIDGEITLAETEGLRMQTR